MVKVGSMSRVLAVMAAIALSASVAYAGGSAGGAGLSNQHYKCYLITGGDDAGRSVVDLIDQFTPTNPDGTAKPDRVRVGRARFVCTPVEKIVVKCPDGSDPSVTDPNNPEAPPTCELPRVIAEEEVSDHLTCYDMERRGVDDPNEKVTLTNQFVKGSPTAPETSGDQVKVRISVFLCAPTIKALGHTP